MTNGKVITENGITFIELLDDWDVYCKVGNKGYSKRFHITYWRFDNLKLKSCTLGCSRNPITGVYKERKFPIDLICKSCLKYIDFTLGGNHAKERSSKKGNQEGAKGRSGIQGDHAQSDQV